jgi:hypothetical protein
MRRDDQPVKLFIAIVGKRKNRPIAAAGSGPHFDATDDAIGGRRSRNLDAVAVGVLKLDRIGQIDRLRVAMDIDRFNGAGARSPE